MRLYNERTKKFERKEKWQRLDHCDEMTKREAARARDGLVVEVNNQVFTLRDQIPFRDFVSLYDCAGIVREERTGASHLDAHLDSPLNAFVVGPQRLERQTSTVSRAGGAPRAEAPAATGVSPAWRNWRVRPRSLRLAPQVR